ncbi:MAG: hypothetical protein K2L81_05670 [Muribaculaceae bacterium]|nr:hypothetical protein [Muribaculaceae bacterium]
MELAPQGASSSFFAVFVILSVCDDGGNVGDDGDAAGCVMVEVIKWMKEMKMMGVDKSAI